MKRIICFIFVCCILFLLFSVNVGAEGESIYTVEMSDGAYRFLKNGTVSAESDTLDGLIDGISGLESRIRFDNVTADEEITLDSGSYIFCGALSANGITVSEGASITLDGCAINLSGSVSLMGGVCKLKDGVISSGETAVRLDFSSLSSFEMHGGSLVSASDKPVLLIKQGTARLHDGTVTNTAGIAIEAHGGLRLGEVEISGRGQEIRADSPIWLATEESEFVGSLRIVYDAEFSEGTSTCVLYNTTEESCSQIRLFDVNGLEYPLTVIDGNAAVHLPFKVRFIYSGGMVAEAECLRGERISYPEFYIPTGYSLTGWYQNAEYTTQYDFASEVTSSMTLYAGCRLNEPRYSINGFEAVYDGIGRELGFAELSHELSGIYTYEWYDGEERLISTAPQISLKQVADSGLYKCKLTFTHGTDTVTVETPYIGVEIRPLEIPIPTVPTGVYSGRAQYPQIDGEGFEYTELSYTDAGTYRIALTLSDPQNTRWQGSESAVAGVDFVIEKANNYFVGEIYIADIYYRAEISFSAQSAFGIPTLIYGNSPDGSFSDTPPSEVGSYYAKAVVTGTDNYRDLISDPIEFRIIEDVLTLFSVATYPTKSVYRAFEEFDPSGLCFDLGFASGRTERIDGDLVSFSYASGDRFSVTHSYVFATYLGQTAILPVTVLPASYELDVFLESGTVIFDGAYHTLTLSGSMPTGDDGIPLEYTISGGGTNAGVYMITAVFHGDSVEYSIPEPIVAYLEILPRTVSAQWGMLEFVYDGTPKAPTASYRDINGATISLSVSGGASLAGNGYIAVASASDKNYLLDNSTAIFDILRADYDLSGVYWSADGFIYDGLTHSVTISGLPSGVSVVGYIDNSATEAGEYTARAVLSYDKDNFNPIPEQTMTYRVLKADYDLSGIKFIGGEYVYDGEQHYPLVQGNTPVGADGIPLGYRFVGGVLNATDDPTVTVAFSTASKNYNTPPDITVSVSVIPRGIYVKWTQTELIYNGTEQSAIATADECIVLTAGAARDAGVYTATAFTENPNYLILNPTSDFRIAAAANLWTAELTVGDVFLDTPPSPSAEALFGTVTYLFYADATMEEQVEPPFSEGRYYAVAVADAGPNYTELVSLPVPFLVKPILPVELLISGRSEYTALDRIADGDISVTLLNNDGSTVVLNWSEYTVSYPSGECFSYGDTQVSVRYGKVLTEYAVSVSRAEYDMSGARWEGIEVIYNGEPFYPELIGLPDGVSVSEYVGAGKINAGEYTVFAILDYDSHNYAPPATPTATLTIGKRGITPVLNAMTFTGLPQSPTCRSVLYTPVDISFIDAGSYEVTVSLTDEENYYLESETATFVILPAVINVTVRDSEKFWFDDPEPFGIQLENGITASMDELMLDYFVEGGKIYVTSANPNYELVVTAGSILRRNRFSPEVTRTLFICLLLFLLIIFAVLIIVIRRDDVRLYCRRIFGKRAVIATAGGGEYAIAECVSVSVERADELISDSIAKTLVRAEECILTEGRRRYVVNVDELNENFIPGERVDVNVLKARGIIPDDAGYIKILARGTLSKPLRVYANSFSLAAVKMIALTGGEAYRVKTK